METKQQRPSQMVDLTQLPPLPPGWCWTTLETVADIEGGITKDQKRQHDGPVRDVPYLRVANVQRGFLDLSEVKSIAAPEREIEALRLVPGDILFTEGGDRDKLGRGWVWGGELAECIHQNHIFRARPCLDAVVPKFVSMHGNFFGRQWFTRTGKQTTNLASINKGVLRNFPVPVAPLDEQRRIVAKVEELFSDLDVAVAALERVRAKLKRYRAAVLKAAIDGKLTADWHARHPNTEPASALLDRILAERRRRWEDAQRTKFTAADKEPPKGWQAKYPEAFGVESSSLPPLPEGWCWAKVIQLGDVQLGRQRSPEHHTGPHMRPYLRVANVFEDRIDTTDVLQMNFTPDEFETYRLESGDILLNEGQSLHLVGRPAMYRGEVPGACFQNTLVRFRASPGLVPQYALYVFLAYLHNKRFQKVARWTVNIAHLGADRFSQIEFPLPPTEEQAEIVREIEARLTVVDKATAQVDANLKRAARLRQGILKRAFEGKLVPQIATDQPASVLLDRIRQQRSLPPLQPAGTKSRKPARRTPIRAVLEVVGRQTAYIIAHAVTPFGRTIMAKLHYLAQTHLGLPLGLKFKREKYGPFDEDIHKAERVGRKRGWFDFKDQAKERTTYTKTAGTPAAAAEAATLLGNHRAEFDQLLAHFAALDSAGAEQFATVYAAWNDLLLDGRPADEAAITAEVYGWHPLKREKFTPAAIADQIARMWANGYNPMGQGERTVPVNLTTGSAPKKRK